MVELIKIVEGFFACGVAASVYGFKDGSGNIQPDAVFANVGKLLLATQIYDMQRLAALRLRRPRWLPCPVPTRTTIPATAASLAAVLAGRPDIPAAQRMEVARLLEDLTASFGGLVFCHQPPWRRLARGDEARDLAAVSGRRQGRARRGLLERGVAAEIARPRDRQPGRCCVTGCTVPEAPAARALSLGPCDGPRPLSPPSPHLRSDARRAPVSAERPSRRSRSRSGPSARTATAASAAAATSCASSNIWCRTCWRRAATRWSRSAACSPTTRGRSPRSPPSSA